MTYPDQHPEPFDHRYRLTAADHERIDAGIRAALQHAIARGIIGTERDHYLARQARRAIYCTAYDLTDAELFAIALRCGSHAGTEQHHPAASNYPLTAVGPWPTPPAPTTDA
jgi:hypothetical protein